MNLLQIKQTGVLSKMNEYQIKKLKFDANPKFQSLEYLCLEYR